jgi:hypothetical protein
MVVLEVEVGILLGLTLLEEVPHLLDKEMQEVVGNMQRPNMEVEVGVVLGRQEVLELALLVVQAVMG